jgi:dihydroorotate dehydrogenase
MVSSQAFYFICVPGSRGQAAGRRRWGRLKNMYYSLIKKLLFRLDPEASHRVTLKALKIAGLLKITKEFCPSIAVPIEIMGLQFFNPVGLAAGLDKNGDYIDALADLGFGFLEIGTVTRRPQEGNPLPRLFRLPEHEAIINRMGFNNKGIDYLIERLKTIRYKGVLGINIGKNRDTPVENAVDDYLYLYRRVIPYASYVTINISSPNTEGLRSLQHGESLRALLQSLKKEQTLQHDLQKKYVPLVVKIAPDLTQQELESMAEIFLAEKMDGVIATNTTLSREGVEVSPFAKESGGLSGKPVYKSSTEVVKSLYVLLQNKIPIIGCGGIFSGNDAKDKMLAGASLVQLYSGLIYEGPALIEACVRGAAELLGC